MFTSRFMKTSAIGALVASLLITALPAEAQERRGREDRSWGQGERANAPQRALRGDGGERRRGAWDNSGARPVPQDRPEEAPREQRRGSYGATRDGSYGAYARGGDDRDARQDVRRAYRAGQQADQRGDRADYRQGYLEGRREDWRDDRRDEQRAYAQGYRAGDRSDDRYGRDRRWDNRGWDHRAWRNDNRYDWYRYRAANRSLFSLGRYYAPFRGYRYSRVGIGFRLGSPFYSSRYLIADPWRYRLPAVYGPYRWVRYYDDALLVDVYSGQVVDAIHGFFW